MKRGGGGSGDGFLVVAEDMMPEGKREKGTLLTKSGSVRAVAPSIGGRHCEGKKGPRTD